LVNITPLVPELPDEPEVPELPDEPDVPDEPELPDVPELPLEPDVPLEPDDAAVYSVEPILSVVTSTLPNDPVDIPIPMTEPDTYIEPVN
jgi:hypothetical protein